MITITIAITAPEAPRRAEAVSTIVYRIAIVSPKYKEVRSQNMGCLTYVSARSIEPLF